MCGVRSPFSAEGTKVWNYNSIWSGGKNVLLVPEVRRFGVVPSFIAEAKNVLCTPPLHAKINNACKSLLLHCGFCRISLIITPTNALIKISP